MNITNPSFNPVHVFSKHIFTKDYTKLETPQKFAVFALYILANIPTFGLINIHLYCKFRATLIKPSQTPVPSNLFKQRVKSSSANQGLQLAASVPVAKRVEMSEFQQYSGGATSDHAWRTFNASVKNKKDVTFSVKYGTWNLLNKCTSPNKHSGFGNNPMNLKEKDNDYTIRKLTQIEEIRRLIKGGKFGETDVEPVDTLLFQEIDFYQEKKEPFLTVYKAFKQMLKDEGWRMKGTDPKIPTKIQDPFVVIYNPKKLVTENIFLDGCFQQKNKNLGAEGTFQRILKEYPRILSPKFQLASVHLGFQVQIPSDPRSIQNMENKTNSDIASYQKKQLETYNRCAFVAGDFNGSNLDSSRACGDYRYASTFDAQKVEQRGNLKEMTIMDGREPTKRKLFDFTVFNPSKQTQCSVQECELSYFENVAEGGVKLAYTDLRKDSSVPIHSSEFGKHWEKGTKEKHKQDP